MKLTTVIFLIMIILPSSSLGLEAYVVQYGEPESIPCSCFPCAMACWSSPKQVVCMDEKCVEKELLQGATRVWKIRCYVGSWYSQCDPVEEQEVVTTKGIRPRKKK